MFILGEAYRNAGKKQEPLMRTIKSSTTIIFSMLDPQGWFWNLPKPLRKNWAK